MYDVFNKINTGLWHDLELGKITYGEIMQNRWNKVFDALGIKYDGPAFEKYFKGRLFDNAIPIEGAKDALEYLSGKYILCVASNGPFAQQVNRLKISSILPYFEHLFISEDLGVSKPDKEFFNKCIGRIGGGIRPEEMIIIGDSLTSDMKGGIDSGLKTCFYDRKRTGDTKGLAVDYVIDRLEKIKEIL